VVVEVDKLPLDSRLRFGVWGANTHIRKEVTPDADGVRWVSGLQIRLVGPGHSKHRTYGHPAPADLASAGLI